MDQTRFLSGGGELGALTRAYDWAASPLGPPGQWPQSLRTAVRLMLTSHHPMFIFWGPDLIQFYNDAYRQTMGPERHPSALGDKGRDCWAEIWPIIGPQIDMVMRGEGATWHEDQLVPVTRFGSRQDVWWTYSYSPIDADDGVGGVLVVCKDVTDEHLAREAFAAANRRLADEMDRLREMFSQAPGFMAVVAGPDHVFQFANSAYLKLIGRTDIVGNSVREVMPDIAGQGFFELLDGVYRSGKAHVGSGVVIQFQPDPDGPTGQHYLDFVYQPVRDAAGTVTGIFVEGYDVTDRMEGELRRNLIVEEMNHRVKNTLATVQALAMMSGKSATTVQEFKTTLGHRISSMAKTQDLLTRGHSRPVPVHDVIRAELEPYMGAGEQVVITCPELTIAPQGAVSLGLLVHELTTNAAKYGALSGPKGTLAVRCEVDPAGARLIWRETCPSKLPQSQPPGFGTRLVQGLARDLGGTAAMGFGEMGLEAVITFRLGERSSPGRPGEEPAGPG
ncbi:PAS domain-containing sensor histidine kinase [Brevundimonas sp.]|uniref:PAS domain-containing sensor histidine kinase n=1 Tax=Brevundimonas sp. TaxID=1871086 RepID=UPI00272FD927|nr:HWE histidine kinase domain-containing protein [Brevundimonas sp.]MDP1913178.1 HWE histidine kinase domain-containing protein [Brevundimonas sp.]